jgi:L-iditol 2-dehydrogenase
LTSHFFPHSGAGPIGLITLLAARAAGAEPIVITDLFQNRLDIARKLVPNVRTCLVERADSPEMIAEKIKEKAGVDIKLALECTGVESSIRAAIFVSFRRDWFCS